MVPATYRNGPLLVCVSTSGLNPAAACLVRDRLAAYLAPKHDEIMAQICSRPGGGENHG